MTDRNSIETLTLYKNPKLYNGSRYKVYQTGVAYDNWLASNSTGKLELSITYQSLSEPITLGYSVPDMDAYTYGCITNDGQDYYIFIDTIQTDQFQMTTINYTVDWWATYWNTARCTKAHLTRSPTKPGYMEQPYTPISTSVSLETLNSNYVIMATYIPSGHYTTSGFDTSYIANIIMEGNSFNTRLVETGNWVKALGLAYSDIKDCFVVPLFSYSEIKSEVEYEEVYDVTATTVEAATSEFRQLYNGLLPLNDGDRYHCINVSTGNLYTAEYDSSQTDNLSVSSGWVYNVGEDNHHMQEYVEHYTSYYDSTHYTRYLQSQMQRRLPSFTGSTLEEVYETDHTVFEKTISKTFTSTETYKQGIIDWNGNLIWECPYGVEISSFKVRMLRGISHIMLEFIPENNQGNMLTGKGFTYDCRHPGLFVDEYQEYVMKNRDYDIAMRQIQSDKQVWTSAVSTVENIGFGAAFGQKTGAVAAGIGGVVETIGTYAINNIFDPKIQQQYDNRYQRMTDQISLVGDSITDIFKEIPLSKYTLTMDTATQTRMNNDIAMNGYYCDEVTTSLSSLFASGVVLQADNVTVEGALPLAGKQQIVRRLQNGVEFI